MSSKTSCDKLLLLFHRFNNLESLSLTNHDKLFNSSIKKLQIYLCRLHSLDLSDCSYLTDKGLTTAASSCPLLPVIRLRDCNSITDKGLKYLTKFCKSLKLVDLSGCFNITDTGIGYLNQNCCQLRALRISACRNIRGLGFLGFSRSLVSLEAERCMLDSGGVAAILCGVGIEYLNLSFERLYSVAPKAIGLGANVANIKILKIGGRYIDVDSDTIMNIAKGCPLLQEWKLSSCEKIDISGWKSIGLYCQNLKTIHVNFHERLNMFNKELMDASLIALSHFRLLSVIYMNKKHGWLRRSPREVRDVMRQDVKIIEYEEVSKNTISWDSWDFTI